jgi:hypothetical protein
MARISVRLTDPQAQAIDAWALQLASTRSLIVRGLLEHAIAAGSPPTPALSARAAREKACADEVARLNALARR